MRSMHRIEFFSYTAVRKWGVRVDGTDLRSLAAEAARPLWLGEEHVQEMTPEEQERTLLHQYGGVPESDLVVPAARHFLGEGAAEFRDTASGTQVVLGCVCTVWECWPLHARVEVAPETVTWSGFRQTRRPEWGELPLGPYVFDRAAYEHALARPVHLADDPLDELPRPGTEKPRA